MPLYTFYPFRADGYAATLVCEELPNDLAAMQFAGEILAAHPSAFRISVLEGDRQVADVPGPAVQSGSAHDAKARAHRSRDLPRWAPDGLHAAETDPLKAQRA
jgi:hypothetical protein